MNISQPGGTRGARVAASATTPAGTYTGLAARTIASASIDYKVYKKISVQVTVQNLTGSFHRNNTYAPGAPAYTHTGNIRDNGIEYVFGVKGEY